MDNKNNSENKDINFNSNYILDSKKYKEFLMGYISTRKFVIIDLIILIISSLLLLYTQSYSIIMAIGIVSIILLLILRIVGRNKNSYKVSKDLNNGIDLNINVTINKEKIILTSDNGNISNYTFNQIISLAETTNLIILKFKHNLGIIIDKNTLTGGTKEELINYLLSVCENIKKKKIIQSKSWIILRKCSFVFLLLVFVLSIILNIFENQKMDRYLDILKGYNYEIEEKIVQRGGTDVTNLEITDNSNHFYAELMEFDSNESAEDTINYWLSYSSSDYTVETGKNYEKYYFEEDDDLYVRKDNIVLNVHIYSYEDDVFNNFLNIIDKEILINK